MDELLYRQMPHSLEAEQAVLGSMLIDASCIKEVMDKLRPDDFYLKQNREIFETIQSMFLYSKPVDGVTVAPDPVTGEAKLFVACALDTDERFTDQIFLQFTLEGEYETEYRIPTGNTVFGIQNLDYDWEKREFWFSTYGPERDFQPKETLYCVSGDLTKVLRKYAYSSPYGIECLGNEGFFASVQFGVNGNRGGIAYSCPEEQFRLPAAEKFMTAHHTEEDLAFMQDLLRSLTAANGASPL